MRLVGLIILHLCSGLFPLLRQGPHIPTVPFPKVPLQPRGPWARLCTFPPFLLDWKAVALDTLSSTLCCPKVLTERAEGG